MNNSPRRDTYTRILTNPWDSNICELILCINKLVEYIHNFSIFLTNPRLPNENIINFIEFVLTHKCQKKILIHRLDSTTKSFNELIELCEHLDTSKIIFRDKGDDTNLQNNPSITLNITDHPLHIRKGRSKTVRKTIKRVKQEQEKSYLTPAFPRSW